MRSWLKNLYFVALSLVLFPGVALSQTAAGTPEKPTSNVVPLPVTMALQRPEGRGFDEDLQKMLKELLREVKPAEIAAEVFGIPVEKIEVVPHIYWREPKWVDWAEKADHATGPSSATGPDGKLVMTANIIQYAQLQLEFGPVPWKKPSEGEKFRRAAEQVLERVAAKMVRLAPEFSVNFMRHQRDEEYNKIERRLREVNEKIENLRRELGEEGGLPPAQLTERFADLAKQELSTRLSLDVMKARENAIRRQMDVVKAQADAKVADNPTLRTLRRIVELRKSRFENLKQQKSQGVVPQADVDKAEEEMLAAMVEVDRAASAQQKDASQAQLDQLSGELSKLAVDRAEAEARLQFLANAVPATEAQLAKRREIDARSDEFRSRLTALERRRSELQEQRNQAEDVLNLPIEPLQLSLPER